MRQGSNGRRPRGRPHRKQHGGSPRHNSFDSNGPDGRVRGNAHQVYEKYVALARDALSSGDRISAETYYQHAEHYYRILNASTDPRPNGQGQPRRQGGNGQTDAAGLEAERRATAQPGGATVAPGPEATAAAPEAQPRAAAQRRPRKEPESEQPEPEEPAGEESGTAGT